MRALRNPREETLQSASGNHSVVVPGDAPQAGRQKERAVRGHLVRVRHDRSVGQLKPRGKSQPYVPAGSDSIRAASAVASDISLASVTGRLL
jgi:hypothetical protein